MTPRAGSSAALGARSARVGVTRSPNAGLSGNPDTYTDLVKLDVTAVAYVPPSIDSAQPTGSNVRPDAVINIGVLDGSTQVNTNTIRLTVDGSLVAPAIAKSGANTTVQYDPPGLLAPSSAHSYRLVFSDNGVVPVAQTNDPVQLDQVLTTLQRGTRRDLQRLLQGYGEALTTPVRGLTAAV